MFCRSFKPNQKAISQAGLTIVEMMVVLAIFTIVSTIILGNLPAFKNRLALDLLAEEVALVVRQAQVYGTATRVFGQQFPSYGVYLPIEGDSFVLFADKDANNKYDEGELQELFKLHGGVNIKDILFCNPGAVCLTSKQAYALGLRALAVLYQRPSSDASIYSVDLSEPPNYDLITYSYVTVELYSEKNKESRGIAIWRTGHIYTCRVLNSC